MQFKVTLRDVDPPVWRQIQVPGSYTFWDLHVAIQDAMGWEDYHLHEFEIRDPATGKPAKIGMPDEDVPPMVEGVLAGWEQKIADYFTRKKKSAVYKYDFGDGWHHSVVFEGAFPVDADVKYPVCLAGARACPPEDCGGPWRYTDFLEAIADPKRKEHEDLVEWIGSSFDPEQFDAAAVRFDDPHKRWKHAFEDWQ